MQYSQHTRLGVWMFSTPFVKTNGSMVLSQVFLDRRALRQWSRRRRRRKRGPTVMAGVDMGTEGFEFESCRFVDSYFRKERRL